VGDVVGCVEVGWNVVGWKDVGFVVISVGELVDGEKTLILSSSYLGKPGTSHVLN